MRILLVARLLKARNFQPLALEYLAACLKRDGHTVRLADASFPARVLRLAADLRPKLVGYYATTGVHRSLLALNRRLKERLAFTAVFGGPHPTYFPEMIEEPGVDAVCRGEAEEAFPELVGALESGGDPAGVCNFWVRTQDGIAKNPLRPLVQDLDALPLPDWHLADELPYCRTFPVKIFIASRGCPFACSFCYNPNFRELYRGERVFRQRRPLPVVEEIVARRRDQGFSFTYLFDDTFGTRREWLAEFCELYRERVGLPFFVNLRADAVTEEGVRALAGAGLAFCGVGLETGSERLRQDVLNKRVADADLLEAARLLKKYRVPFMTFNMLGLPATALADDLETLRMNWRLCPDFAEPLMFQPYPKTVLGQRAIELGLFSGDPEKIPATFKRKSPLAIPDAARRVRLLYLFPILAARPRAEPRVRLLLALPLGPLYRLASRIYEGAVKLLRIYRVRVPPAILVRIFWHYLRY